MKRNQFTFYRSFYEALLPLPKKKQFAALMAVIRYALDEVMPEGLEGGQSIYFCAAKPILDSARRKAINGSTGGKISRRGAAEKISKGENKVEDKKKNEYKYKTETEGFPEFWERYPLKVGMEAAREQWERVCEDKNDILFGLEAWRNSRQWAIEEGRYVPRADKWLRERWWEQTPPGYIPKGASGLLGKAEIEAIEQLFDDEGGTV